MNFDCFATVENRSVVWLVETDAKAGIGRVNLLYGASGVETVEGFEPASAIEHSMEVASFEKEAARSIDCLKFDDLKLAVAVIEGLRKLEEIVDCPKIVFVVG